MNKKDVIICDNLVREIESKLDEVEILIFELRNKLKKGKRNG